MSYHDWLKNFDICNICNLTPEIECAEFIDEGDREASGETLGLTKEAARLMTNMFSLWKCSIFHGEWKRGVSAGGRGQSDPSLVTKLIKKFNKETKQKQSLFKFFVFKRNFGLIRSLRFVSEKKMLFKTESVT